LVCRYPLPIPYHHLHTYACPIPAPGCCISSLFSLVDVLLALLPLLGKYGILVELPLFGSPALGCGSNVHSQRKQNSLSLWLFGVLSFFNIYLFFFYFFSLCWFFFFALFFGCLCFFFTLLCCNRLGKGCFCLYARVKYINAGQAETYYTV
jgi:hypothetical protein